jgi:predicted transcriptional regulator of viral defense system
VAGCAEPGVAVSGAQPELLPIANRNTIDQALTRLLRKGIIRRISHGLYLYPQSHPMLGEAPASVPAVLAALNATEPTPLVASGAYACFLLGVIRDMPSDIVLLSASTTRDIQLPTVRMQIRIAAPRYLAGAGRLSGVLHSGLAPHGHRSD